MPPIFIEFPSDTDVGGHPVDHLGGEIGQARAVLLGSQELFVRTLIP